MAYMRRRQLIYSILDPGRTESIAFWASAYLRTIFHNLEFLGFSLLLPLEGLKSLLCPQGSIF